MNTRAHRDTTTGRLRTRTHSHMHIHRRTLHALISRTDVTRTAIDTQLHILHYTITGDARTTTHTAMQQCTTSTLTDVHKIHRKQPIYDGAHSHSCMFMYLRLG